jgi:hypothetical protein
MDNHLAMSGFLNTVPLADTMLAIARRDHLSDFHPMVIDSKALNDALLLADIPLMLSVRNRARKTYARYTGEPFNESY